MQMNKKCFTCTIKCKFKVTRVETSVGDAKENTREGPDVFSSRVRGHCHGVALDCERLESFELLTFSLTSILCPPLFFFNTTLR
jgi:hypothetical protein